MVINFRPRPRHYTRKTNSDQGQGYLSDRAPQQADIKEDEIEVEALLDGQMLDLDISPDTGLVTEIEAEDDGEDENNDDDADDDTSDDS